MKPVLTRFTTCCDTRLDIEESDLQKAESSKELLLNALYIEEKFDYVLQNYREFELSLIVSNLDHMLFNRWSSPEVTISQFHQISRRIVNLLTTSRAYLDQLGRHIDRINGSESGENEFVKKLREKEYDDNFSYRFVEALRNYTQHRDIPIDSSRYPGDWVEIESGWHRRHIGTAKIQIDKLRKDEKFKRTVLNELSADIVELDMRFLIRHYMDSLGRIHIEARKLVREKVEYCEEYLYGLIDRLATAEGQKKGLYAHLGMMDDRGIATDRVEIPREFIDRRRDLEKTNRYIIFFSTQYISSELQETDIL